MDDDEVVEAIDNCQKVLRNRSNFLCGASSTCSLWNNWIEKLKNSDNRREFLSFVTLFVLTCDTSIIESYSCVIEMGNIAALRLHHALNDQYQVDLDEIISDATMQHLIQRDLPELQNFCVSHLMKYATFRQREKFAECLLVAGETFYNQELFHDSLRAFVTMIQCSMYMSPCRQWELVENLMNSLVVLVHNIQPIPVTFLLNLFQYTADTVFKLHPDVTLPDISIPYSALHHRVVSNMLMFMWCALQIDLHNLYSRSYSRKIYEEFVDVSLLTNDYLRSHMLKCVFHAVKSCDKWDFAGDGILHVLYKGLHETYTDSKELLLFTTTAALAITKFYINLSGDVNYKDAAGNTALMILCQIEHESNIDENVMQIVKMLLKNGAHLDIPNRKRQIPMEMENAPKPFLELFKKWRPIPLQCLTTQVIVKKYDVYGLQEHLPRKIWDCINIHRSELLFYDE